MFHCLYTCSICTLIRSSLGYAQIYIKRHFLTSAVYKRDYEQTMKSKSNFSSLGTIGWPAWKVSKYGLFSSPYFPVFGLNRVIYSVNFRIQSEYGKIRTMKNSVFGNFRLNESSWFSRFMVRQIKVFLFMHTRPSQIK